MLLSKLQLESFYKREMKYVKRLFSIFTVSFPLVLSTRKCIVWSKCLIMCKGFLGTFFRCLFYFRGWVCLDVVAKPNHPVLRGDVNADVSKVKSFFIKWPKATIWFHIFLRKRASISLNICCKDVSNVVDVVVLVAVVNHFLLWFIHTVNL